MNSRLKDKILTNVKYNNGIKLLDNSLVYKLTSMKFIKLQTNKTDFFLIIKHFNFVSNC